MNNEEKQLIQKALQLPLEARAALAGSLLDSLDNFIDPEHESEWQEEIRTRVQAIDAGKVQMTPWSEARSIILGENAS